MHRPLAEGLRPKDWSEIVGLDAIERTFLERIKRGLGILPSIILWGPPGCGKTSFARLIKTSYQDHLFVELSAVLSGVKEVKEVCERAKEKPTILFIDEIHRFNKSQQDAFLPFIERGDVSLIGATTENPSFYLNPALLSRAKVIKLPPISEESLISILRRAEDETKLELDPDARILLSKAAQGDARKLLNIFEALVTSSKNKKLTKEDLEPVLNDLGVLFYNEEEHYNLISAFIKSLRGSDPDAALFWGFKMLESGEDPRFLIRRMIIFASEDIGNADPRALGLSVATAESFDRLGLPEGRIPIAQCITYLATAPKSNRSYIAMNEAISAVKKYPRVEVPLHLRNAPTKLMKEIGYGKGYVYPHDSDETISYLPFKERFYEPSDSGYERNIRELIKRRAKDPL
jgi:putative ATPase